MTYAEEIRTLELIVRTLENCPQRTGKGERCTCRGEWCGMSEGGYWLSEAIEELEILTSRK